MATLLAAPAQAQSITTQQDQISPDAAEIAALAAESNGDVYSLSHDKKMRVATLSLKYYIRSTFSDPDSVKAVITNDPKHVDLKVWQGLMNGGNKIYSGMEICALINGKNAYGAYVGDKKYLLIMLANGQAQSFVSPYHNAIFDKDMLNETVERECP